MTIEEANTFLNNLKVCIEEHPIVADWLVEIADRKTENCSEKPNNCDTCKHNKLEWYSEECDGCSQAHSNYEPQTSRENTRDSRDNHEIATDEPQTHDLHTNTHECVSDAPQTDCPWK